MTTEKKEHLFATLIHNNSTIIHTEGGLPEERTLIIAGRPCNLNTQIVI